MISHPHISNETDTRSRSTTAAPLSGEWNITNIYVGGDMSGNLIAGNDNEASTNTSKSKKKLTR